MQPMIPQTGELFNCHPLSEHRSELKWLKFMAVLEYRPKVGSELKKLKV